MQEIQLQMNATTDEVQTMVHYNNDYYNSVRSSFFCRPRCHKVVLLFQMHGRMHNTLIQDVSITWMIGRFWARLAQKRICHCMTYVNTRCSDRTTNIFQQCATYATRNPVQFQWAITLSVSVFGLRKGCICVLRAVDFLEPILLSEVSCTWGTCRPDSMATLVNSLLNPVSIITLCITLNANTGQIVRVTLCIQIEWLFYNPFWRETVHESDADSIGHGNMCPTFTNDWTRGRGTESRRTKNQKVTKLYWPSRKRSQK